MTWTRLSDDFTDRPEFISVSRSARLLLVELYVWSNRMLTDGLIPRSALTRLTDGDTAAEVEELAEAGLATLTAVGITIDWSDQERAEDVLARRAAQAAKQKRYRDRKARHERGDHSACDPRFCASHVTSNATSNETGVVTPSRPDPSRPVPEGQGQDAEADPAAAGRLSSQGESGPGGHRFIAPADAPDLCSLCGMTREDGPHIEVVA